jgi:hypothetical protein
VRHSLARPLSLLLALATGAVVGWGSGLLAEPVPQDVSSAATAHAARAFYEAVDAVLETGDIVPLDGIVAPDFVDHAHPPGSTPDRAGLGRTLLALRATAPSAQLTADDLTAVGDRAMIQVAMRNADRRDFAGLTIERGPVPWSAVDVLRIAGGRVVERWGDPASILLEPAGALALPDQRPAYATVTLERITLQAGAVLAGTGSETRLLQVESGQLVRGFPSDATGPASPDPVDLARGGSTTSAGPGDVVELPAGAAYGLVNPGPGDTVTIAAVIAVPQAQPPATPAGATAVTLAGGVTARLASGPLTLSFGRVTLAPGAELRSLPIADLLLMTVEAGSIIVDTDLGHTWVRERETGLTNVIGSGVLASGDGAFVPAGENVTLRKDDETSTTVFVAVMAPQSPTTANAPAAAD